MLQTKVELDGPFFTRDVRKTVRQNIADFEETLAEYGEAKARAALEGKRGSMPRWTGWSHERIVGRTRSEMRRGGKAWQVTAVVSANTDGMSKADAIRTKAAASRYEARFGIFRRTTFAIRAKMRSVNLTKSIE